MSFSVVLYQNSSPVEKIGKTLTATLTVSDVVLKRDTSILKPVILISSAVDLSGVNYMYISQFSIQNNMPTSGKFTLSGFCIIF